METKTLSDGWSALQERSVTIRDETRARFFADLGLEPSEDVDNVDIPPAERLSNILKVIDTALAGPEKDPDAAAITLIAKDLLTSFSPGYLKPENALSALSLYERYPIDYRDFFLNDETTSYELSEEGA